MKPDNFKEQLIKYANLIVNKGANIKPGQEVVLYINVDQAPLAHLIVAAAYKAGASKVIVKWNDTFTKQQFLKNAAPTHLKNIPDYQTAEAEYIAHNKVARISVISEDPNAFNNIDKNRIAMNQAALNKSLHAVHNATINNDLNWTVVAAAGTDWAKQVFPKLDPKQATQKLWHEIFKTTRIDQKDPNKAWEQHTKKLQTKANWLNKEQFKALHYKSPQTNLTVGLPKNHIWTAATSKTPSGIEFLANMPTEEVFTAPDSHHIDGYVTSTKPLSYGGTLLEDLQFKFKNGQVIKATAKNGQKVLDNLLKNQGAKSLGEVSLVPDQSPISQSNLTFFNTLFDENASDHMALGAAYPFTIKDGEQMTPAELEQQGLNISPTHVDFMMGSDDMNIDGIKKDGTKVPIFRNGNWVE